jgi:ABC-type lipoprotein export system ATPase subunit
MVTHNPENQQFFHRTVVLRDGAVECELPACEAGTPLYRPARV